MTGERGALLDHFRGYVEEKSPSDDPDVNFWKRLIERYDAREFDDLE